MEQVFYYSAALSFAREPIPTDAGERSADADKVQIALADARVARNVIYAKVTALDAQRNGALLHGEIETVRRVEAEIKLATLELERLGLVEAKLRHRLFSLAETNVMEPAQ